MNIIEKILSKTLLEREILPKIVSWISKKEAIILSGSRQVGKTSLLYLTIQHLVNKLRIKPDDIFYFDLEFMDNLALLNDGIDNLITFIKEHNPSKTLNTGSVKRSGFGAANH